MKKILTVVLTLAVFTFSLSALARSPSEMLVIIGVVKYYNQNCSGLNFSGVQRMNKGLKYFKMHQAPIAQLERSAMAISGYQTAQKFGCKGTKREAQKAGFGQYIN